MFIYVCCLIWCSVCVFVFFFLYFFIFFLFFFFFFFSSRRRHTRCGRDWGSDVCSSDLHHQPADRQERVPVERAQLGAQGPGGLVHHIDGAAVAEAADPGGLRERGRVRPRGVRRAGGVAGDRKSVV